MYGGLTEAVAIYPLSAPGTNRHTVLDLAGASKTNAGQRGIVSALAVGRAPHTYEDEAGGDALELTAVGTFSSTVGIYVTAASWLAASTTTRARQWDVPPRHGSNEAVPGERVCLCGWQLPHGQGVVQLAWHPVHRTVLVVSSRRSSHLYVYDTRYLDGMANPYRFRRLPHNDPSLIAILARPSMHSHQRLWFGMDAQGDYLAAGDEDGMVRIWSWASILGSTSPLQAVAPLVEWQAHAGTFRS